jgi:hypothetical protein
MRRRFDRSIDRFLNSQASISLDYPVLSVLYNNNFSAYKLAVKQLEELTTPLTNTKVM